MGNCTKKDPLTRQSISGSKTKICVISLYYATNYLIYKGEHRQMTNKEISDELDDLAYQTGNMKCVLQLVEDKIEEIGMSKSDSDLSYEFRRMRNCMLCVLNSEMTTSDKIADRISELAIELFKLDKVGEAYE